MYQLDFFSEDKAEIDYLRNDVKQVKESSDKVRKSLYARHSELSKKYIELHQRMEIIEKNICAG